MLIRSLAPRLRLLRVWGLLLLLLSVPLQVHGSKAELDRIKIAFVYKFLGLVEWQGASGKDVRHNLLLAVSGDKALRRRFSVLEGRFIGDRKIEVHAVNSKAHTPLLLDVLFVSQANRNRIDEVTARLGNTPVLTITEGGRDRLQSYMIVLYEQDGYVRFDINNTLARSRGIQFNAKLLELAGRVL